MRKDMEQSLQEDVSNAAQMLLDGEYAGSMQVIRLSVIGLNDEKVKTMMGEKLDIITQKCNASIEATKAALEAEEIDGHVITQNIRWLAAINVQYMAEQYYSFWIKVLSEQGYYNLS